MGISAQTLNPDYPRGVYKIGRVNGSFGNEAKIILDSSNNMFIYAKSSGYTILFKADYTMNKDTALLHFDPVYLYGEKVDNIPERHLKITYSDQFSMLSDMSFEFFKNSDTIPLLKELAAESMIEWNSKDSLRIQIKDNSDSRATCFYVTDENINKITIYPNIGLVDQKEKPFLVQTPNLPNQLKMGTIGKDDLAGALYYVGPVTKDLFDNEPVGQNLKAVKSNFEINKNSYSDGYYSKTDVADIIVYDNLKKAAIDAKMNDKLLRVYVNVDMDSTDFKNSISSDINNSFYVFVNLKEENDSSKSLKVMTPQLETLYADSISEFSLKGYNEDSYTDTLSICIKSFNKKLGEKIDKVKTADEGDFLRQYLLNNLYLVDLYATIDSAEYLTSQKYLNKYIKEYNKYAPDSIVFSNIILLFQQNIGLNLDTAKLEVLSEAQKYLLKNRNQLLPISPVLLTNMSIYDDSKKINTLNIFFLSLLSREKVSFSAIKEALALLPDYSDYLYLTYLVSKKEVISEKDMAYIKSYFDVLSKDIDLSSTDPSHSAISVANERAKKMYETDPVNLIGGVGSEFADIYEISDFYHGMYAIMFNNLAWRAYRNKNFNYVDDFLKYCRIALELDPDNHYYMDTYAHFLYMKGQKSKALEIERKAYAISMQKEGKYSTHSQFYKLTIYAMETNTLEKYNNDDWDL